MPYPYKWKHTIATMTKYIGQQGCEPDQITRVGPVWEFRKVIDPYEPLDPAEQERWADFVCECLTKMGLDYTVERFGVSRRKPKAQEGAFFLQVVVKIFED